jgi:hypothetical protein
MNSLRQPASEAFAAMSSMTAQKNTRRGMPNIPFDILDAVLHELYLTHLQIVLSPTTFTADNWTKFPSLSAEGNTDFHSCSLVSRAWVESSRRWLFRAVVVSSYDTLLVTTKSFPTSLGAHVRHLFISLSSPDNRGLGWIPESREEQVGAALALFPNATEIALRHLVDPCSSTFISLVLRQPLLRALVLDNVPVRARGAGYFDLAPWILAGAGRFSLHVAGADLTNCPALDRLKITQWRCRTSASSTRASRRLYLVLASRNDFGDAGSCLSVGDGTLTHLTLDTTGWCEPVVMNSQGELILSFFMFHVSNLFRFAQ